MRLLLILLALGCGTDEQEAKQKEKCSNLLVAMLKQTETSLYYAANYRRAVDNGENGTADCRMAVHYMEEFVHTTNRALEECRDIKSEEFLSGLSEEKDRAEDTVAKTKGKCKTTPS